MNYKTTEDELQQIGNEGVDWRIEFVYGDTSFKENMCDCHTHGINKHLESGLELQIVLSIEPQLAKYILNCVGKLITAGKNFKSKDKLYGIFKNEKMPIGFIKSKDSEGKDILRIWIPDKEGRLFDKSTDEYRQQDQDPYI